MSKHTLGVKLPAHNIVFQVHWVAVQCHRKISLSWFPHHNTCNTWAQITQQWHRCKRHPMQAPYVTQVSCKHLVSDMLTSCELIKTAKTPLSPSLKISKFGSCVTRKYFWLVFIGWQGPDCCWALRRSYGLKENAEPSADMWSCGTFPSPLKTAFPCVISSFHHLTLNREM